MNTTEAADHTMLYNLASTLRHISTTAHYPPAPSAVPMLATARINVATVPST